MADDKKSPCIWCGGYHTGDCHIKETVYGITKENPRGNNPKVRSE